MTERNLYIVAGCNGAGKTTASFTILPEVLGCYEFVNADEIARGLSPFNPESAAIEAGRIMLDRIDKFIASGVDFAFETTLSTKTFAQKVWYAQSQGYKVTLLFFTLKSPQLAMDRVKKRVSLGGHNIPIDVIERRYKRGITNLFDIYMPIVNEWILCDNSDNKPVKIAEHRHEKSENIINIVQWNFIKSIRDENATK